MQENSCGDFEIVNKMTTSLDPSASSRSVLTNVAPPSALPSFLASVPSPAPSMIPPPGPSIPNPSIPPGSYPPAPSLPSFTSTTTPTTNPSIPTPITHVSSPLPPSSVAGPEMTYPSSRGVPYTVSPGAGIPSAFPPPPSSMHPPPPSQSHSAEMAVDPRAPQPSDVLGPVTSQPQPPSSHGSTDASASVDIGTPGSPGVGGPGGAKRQDGHGWFGWIRGTVSNVGHRVAERAKTSMDSMITTLDPQMKEFIYSGGDMDIIVASDKEVKVGAIREAFQMSFGKATVCGMKAEAHGVAAQPVGFEAALASAEERINVLRSTGQIHPQQPIVAVENFIVEFQTDCWFDLGLLLLDDPGEDILLQTYTQVTPIPPDFVNQARTATPEDYPLKESGFAVTVGQIASQNLQVHHSVWQEALTGVSRREGLVLAGRTLAGLYRSRLPNYH
ncbi:Protein PRRC1 [Chionoecetes opilio]|uniref:Protein PRRC1 n=1 Tax=Chionoecetes opilio TaxID=41210 RepID=A0A8J4Y307_CHIOP|nr:Protein PRRC1 [Chionoecetes opilio]